MIRLFNTYLHPKTIHYLKKIIESTFISEGEEVKLFEQELEKFFNAKVVTVNSGTSALHLSLIAAGIKEHDEVILPAQTFIASGLSILYCKAKPIFADIDLNTGTIQPEDIIRKITPRTKVIMPVHWAGYPCNMNAIKKIAKEYNLTIIEDAAHAFGALYDNQPIGSISDFTCFSFQAIKHLTTGDGGAITTKKLKVYQHLKKLRWFGIDKEKNLPNYLGERQYNLNEIGYKYHMNNIAAAIGRANLLDIFKRINKRRKIAEQYYKAFADFSGIQLIQYPQNSSPSYWLFPLLVEKRKNFIKYMKIKNIEVSVVHQGIHKNKIFHNFAKNIDNQYIFDKQQIHIPIHEGLSNEDVEYIIQTIKQGW